MKKLSPLGEAINHYMKSEAVSWYRLAMLSGVSEGSLTKIKQGKASPTLYSLERISKALNVPLSEIIKRSESHE